MIGDMKMTFNKVTMMEIIQYWLDNKFLNKDEKHLTVSNLETGLANSVSADIAFIATLGDAK